MTAQMLPVNPFDIVIFGGTGDLSFRKLLPALFRRFCDAQMQPESRVICASRRQFSNEEFRDKVADAIRVHATPEAGDHEKVAAFLERVAYVSVDALGDRGWGDLKTVLHDGAGRILIFYLATSPELFVAICDRLAQSDLNHAQARLVLEKPIGKDLKSAFAINDSIGHCFSESQVYRIDHYLGKETVQNLMVLRFGNALFEPLWNVAHIDHIQITVAEAIGLEDRAGYYDTTGALRDVVQNHLLQLLCLVAMEPPAAMNADAVRDEKLKVLYALKPITKDNADQVTVRGQYKAGIAGGQPVPGYQDEIGGQVSKTETFAVLKAEILNWRWAGVPFYLRTGKRLPERVSEIVVTFRQIPHSIFGPGAGPLHQNRLLIRLQPDEGMKLELMAKEPGPGGMRLRPVALDMTFAKHFGHKYPEAYERLLMDVVRGNATLFMRRDEVEAAWSWIDPILEAWSESPENPKLYTAGTWGPTAAIALIERDGRTWHEG